MAPVMPYLNGEPLNILGSVRVVHVQLQGGTLRALVVCSPIIIYQILAFFTPALRPKEQKYFLPTFFMAVSAVPGWQRVRVLRGARPGVRVDARSGEQRHRAVLPEASRYLTGVVMLLLGFGLAFEIPIVIFYLVAFDIVSYKKMRSNWRIAYVVLMLWPPSRPPTGRQ